MDTKLFSEIEALVRGSALQLAKKQGLSGNTDFDEDELLEYTLGQWQSGNFYPISEQYMLAGLGGNRMGGWFSKTFKRVTRAVQRVAKVVEKTVKVAAPLAIGAAATVFGGPAAGSAAFSATSALTSKQLNPEGFIGPQQNNTPTPSAPQPASSGGFWDGTVKFLKDIYGNFVKNPRTGSPIPMRPGIMPTINRWTGVPQGSPRDQAILQRRAQTLQNVNMADLSRLATQKANEMLARQGIRFNSPAGQQLLADKVNRDISGMFGVSGLTAGKLSLFIGIPAAVLAIITLLKKSR